MLNKSKHLYEWLYPSCVQKGKCKLDVSLVNQKLKHFAAQKILPSMLLCEIPQNVNFIRNNRFFLWATNLGTTQPISLDMEGSEWFRLVFFYFCLVSKKTIIASLFLLILWKCCYWWYFLFNKVNLYVRITRTYATCIIKYFNCLLIIISYFLWH